MIVKTKSLTSILLKTPSMVFSTSQFERRSRASLRIAAFRRPVWQRGFQIAAIFNGLQPSKMTVHPCTVRSLLKNRVFQQAAGLLCIVLFAPAAIVLAQSPDVRISIERDASADRQPEKTEFPSYPSIARRDRIEGEATVCFKIDARGKVKRASVTKYSHKIFRKPALRAIRKSSFEPLRPDQVLAKTKSCRTYRFRLTPVVAADSD